MSKDLDIRKNVSTCETFGEDWKVCVAERCALRGFVCGLVSAVSFQFLSFGKIFFNVSPIQILNIETPRLSTLSLFHVFKFHMVLAEPKSSKKK